MRMLGLLPGVSGRKGPEETGQPEEMPRFKEVRPTRESLPIRASPVSEDIRRKLEGGIEKLETAHARYTLLLKALRARKWQERTLRRLNTVRELVRQEPEIQEALARLQQRARAEEWPDTEPALGFARKLERLRSRVEGLACERLELPAGREFHLVDNLARLKQLLTRTIAGPVSSTEGVLLQGAFRLPPLGKPLLTVIGALIALNVLSDAVSPDSGWASLFNVISFLLRSYFYCLLFGESLFGERRPGRFWLTHKRLVWYRSRWRVTNHVALEAIRPDGVRFRSASRLEVCLEDGRQFRLPPLDDKDAKQLARALKWHRQTVPPDAPRELVHQQGRSE